MRKITVLTILGIALLGLTAAATAETATRIRANVPFAFYAGTELMPAGEYVFVIGSFGSGSIASLVQVYNQSGTAASFILTRPGTADNLDDAHLHFNHYGKSYFLSKIEGAGYQARLSPSRAEREMMAQGTSAGTTIVAAAR